MADKLITCKTCGAEMSASAKTCPKCGAKNPQPIYKKWWFWVLIVIIFIAIVSGGDSGNGNTPGNAETEQSEPITYTHYNVTELFDALKTNAMKAEKDFDEQYVEIEGYLGTIDSDGDYICVGAKDGDWDYLFDDVQCYFRNDEQRDVVMELSKGSPIVVRGKITDVGEVLGYRLEIHGIN